ADRLGSAEQHFRPSRKLPRHSVSFVSAHASIGAPSCTWYVIVLHNGARGLIMPALWRLVIAFGLIAAPAAARDAIDIVSAENFYADVARQIAGNHASVSSIMSNPDQDPHLFEATPAVSRLLSGATIVVYNGADYDPWMPKLLAAAKSSR